MRKYWGAALAGSVAGIVNGLFGAGGGMLLIPLLCFFTDLEEDQIFPTSVSIILPVCLFSLLVNFQSDISCSDTIIYLVGSGLGGLFAGYFGKKIPTAWLHRALGILILWGGIRYLC